MRINSKDSTLKKNYIQKYQFLISEYELVKAKKHPVFKYAKEFYAYHGTCPQAFLKYYGRYKNGGLKSELLLPGKRGAKYKTRRTPKEIEHLVILERDKGCNKYEINNILKSKLKDKTPSPSGIYNILKRYGKNKLNVKMKEEKQKIINNKD